MEAKHLETMCQQQFIKSATKKLDLYNRGESPRRILFIGWWGDPANSLTEMFLRKGCEVTWWGDGATNMQPIVPGVDIHYLPCRYETVPNGPLGPCTISVRRVKLNTILELFPTRFDMIFHCQDWEIIESDGKSDIPYFYYWTEMFVPYVPKAATHVICLNDKAVELAKLYYRNQFLYMKMPFALREGMNLYTNTQPQRFTPGGQNRPVQCSFAGKVYGFKFYEPRHEVISHLAKAVPGFKSWCNSFIDPYTGITYPPIGVDAGLCWQAYTDVLGRTNKGINVPTIVAPNFRDFEVPGAGAELVTQDVPGMKELGFKDGVNCHFYKTKEEAAEICKQPYDRKVAFEGHYLVHQEHTWERRFEPFWKYIENKI